MKLTNKDKEYLKSIGYPDNELNQIEIKYTISYNLCEKTKQIT